MIAHRETLQRLLGELSPRVCAASLVALRRRGQYELFLWFASPAAPTVIVEAHFRAGLSTVFCRPSTWKEPERTVPWAEELWGKRLVHLELHPTERQLRWVLETGQELLFFLYGTAQSGVLLRERDGQIRASLGAPRAVLEKLADAPPRRLPGWEEYPAETPLVRALAQDRHQLGSFYAHELCQRCGIAPDTPLGQLSEHERERLRQMLSEFCRELTESSSAFLFRRPEGPPLVSLLPLRGYSEPIAVFCSISDAVAERVRQTLLWEEFRRERLQLQQRLERHARQLARWRQEAEQCLHHAPVSERERLWGNLLLMQPGLHERGRSEIVLPDWEGNPQRIPLDPAKSLRENAEAYFQRARRRDEAGRRARHNLPLLQEREHFVHELLAQLQQVTTRRQLREIAQRLQELFPPREMTTRTGERLRVFHLAAGFVLYLGTDARSNEALTFRFARPHDVFLHVRGTSGAHGILRGPRKGELPPMPILEQAAAVVAYYSRARSASLVPVLYTWRKYVRKLKGTLGAVRLEREQLVWVRPLPPTASESP
ncbi:hypothetical protein HRbin21_00144 [bacterium HR21]|nr:hypothetical protein HRbin21_00144 [bacterium HR21]